MRLNPDDYPFYEGLIKDGNYKLEKPKVTDEDIVKMPFEEKKWFMIFLIMSINEERASVIFNEMDVNEMIKKIYSML